MNKDKMRPQDASGWLKFEGKLFVGTLIGYVAIAAVTGILTVEVLVIRIGMATVSALLIGIAYQLLPKRRDVGGAASGKASLRGVEGRQWRLLLWAIVAVVIVAFIVGRVT